MAKGSVFERSICRKLTDWWNGAPDPDGDVRFWRTSGSGGRVTNRAKRGKKSNVAHCGDIAGLDDDAALFTQYVACELKRGYKDATIHHLLDRSATAAEQTYEEWILQAIASQKAAGALYWMIIHQRDRREILVTVPGAFMEGSLDFSVTRDVLSPLCVAYVDVMGVLCEIATCRFDRLFPHLCPNRIRELSRAHKLKSA